MNERAAALHLDRLRRYRNRKARELTLPIGDHAERLRQAHRRSSGAERVILESLPPALRPAVVSISLTHRMIRIDVSNDGARYAIDRWFRARARRGGSGGGGELLTTVGARSVRVLVKTPIQDPGVQRHPG
jgi:hypothetical protein